MNKQTNLTKCLVKKVRVKTVLAPGCEQYNNGKKHYQTFCSHLFRLLCGITSLLFRLLLLLLLVAPWTKSLQVSSASSAALAQSRTPSHRKPRGTQGTELVGSPPQKNSREGWQLGLKMRVFDSICNSFS